MLNRLAVLLVLILPCWANSASADDKPGQGQLWQALPAEVLSVHLGPDQRIWETVVARTGRQTADRVQAVIQREFAHPAPRLDGVTPILFEPGGRVWFKGDGAASALILGYDGKTWVDRAIQAGHNLTGHVPNQGIDRPGFSENLFVDGTCFFRDNVGVECFDGRAWTYKEFKRDRMETHSICMATEPDGKGVVVLDAEPSIWRWRGGKWSRAYAPLQVGKVLSIAPMADGVWVRTDRDLRFHPYVPVIPDALKAPLAQLADAEAAVRDKAAAALLAMPPSAIPAMGRLLALTEDPELATRLRSIITTLTREDAKSETTVFGPYRFKHVQFLMRLPNQSVCATALHVFKDEKDLGAATVILALDGTARLVTDPAFVAVAQRNYGLGQDGPLAVDDHTIWFSNFKTSTSLLDFKEGKVVHVLADASFHTLLATRPDGALFTSRGPRTPIAIYSPGRRDDRRLLPVETTIAAEHGAVVASDGKIYALKPGGTLQCFDGKRWESTSLFRDSRRLDWGLAGINGDVLIKTDDTFALLGAGPAILGADLQAMIKANRARFLAAFAPGARSASPYGGRAILADKAQNLWLLLDGRVNVLAGDRWLDPDLAFRAAGSATGKVGYIATLGDSSKVYFSGMTDRGTDSVVGEVIEGKISLTPAPHADERIAPLDIKGADGALWLPTTWTKDKSGSPVRGEFPTHFIGDKSREFQIPNAGWPHLTDLNGNTWFVADRGRQPWDISLWRDGRIVRKLKIKGATTDTFRLLADRPGSVWAWTDAGFQHWIVRDSGRPSDYELEATYAVDADLKFLARIQYSSLGLMILDASGDDMGHQRKLHIVRLPANKPNLPPG